MLNLAELNALDRDEFVRVVGPVFEYSPWIAEKTWGRRPFTSREHLHESLCQTVLAADDRAKLDLIRAHPDLAAGMTLTTESRSEQKSAGLDGLSEREIQLFDTYNHEYKEKFGFPFVICARLNKKDAILSAFPSRLKNSPEKEKETAMNEIFKITQLRLEALIK